MYITRFTDYSLRVLIYLAVNPAEKVTIGAIAERYNISKNHLMKVAQTLHNKGYILATRGKYGGLQLHRSADDINIGYLMRELESDCHLVECFGQDNQCVITPGCQLKQMLAEALDSFFATLDKYTLQDLVAPEQKNKLTELLITDIS
jgi:Rrf2 family nitric oxide-sensitive transcriptional repressor|tara:strand:+ start:4788 stop:5231 length:444 start_codon:yes stop_codon:yes gene_type:complete